MVYFATLLITLNLVDWLHQKFLFDVILMMKVNMTYYPDLSPYSYLGRVDDAESDIRWGLVAGPTRPVVLNVGWLDLDYPFPTGETSQIFRARLLEFCHNENLVNLCFGYHNCQFCEQTSPIRLRYGFRKKTWLGNGEIRVKGITVVYASPSLIYHYVINHQYLPPDEFIEAVLHGPRPGSKEHREVCDTL